MSFKFHFIGWWPMYKKIDGFLYKTGRIKMELEVMTKPQALQRPAGFGRSDPNENPEIDEPMWVILVISLFFLCNFR